MPTIVGILIFMGRINFMLSRIEHEKSFITSVPEISVSHQRLYILTEAIYINRTNFTFTFGIIRTNDFLYCIKKFQTQKCGWIIQMMFIFVFINIYIDSKYYSKVQGCKSNCSTMFSVSKTRLYSQNELINS